MKINSIPSFKVRLSDTQFNRKAKDEALNTERVGDYEYAKDLLAQIMPYGTINRYSYIDRDVYTVIPREPLVITIPKKNGSMTKHLDSLIGLSKILNQVSGKNEE